MPQIAQMHHMHALRIQAVDQVRAALLPSAVIVKAPETADPHIRRQGMLPFRVHHLCPALHRIHSTVIPVPVADGHRIRPERMNGIAGGRVKGIRDNAQAAFQFQKELAVAKTGNDHALSSPSLEFIAYLETAAQTAPSTSGSFSRFLRRTAHSSMRDAHA